jgi:hypothetical protein
MPDIFSILNEFNLALETKIELLCVHLGCQEFGSFTLFYDFVSISEERIEEEMIEEFQTHL